ncbi:HAD-IIB family hydrolase [Deinococcus peraridilitoris]|uniref:HAD-superfamily hydrolase, subfamily IIB n=1 Tax=Deinococcus peraridilitoris (strain DSM 19664 / LMG 22246 / CIP 109416 / KR-200) TaxID=937777 RepID=L0A1K5_DEIPD|nr:HAD family hydrolase [Deinococcus peraridilitoris]AFZ67778.1 HAD-superfamily hydrolase, subfamily IIB [Deinococcus peraridilitoris DSM 19664]
MLLAFDLDGTIVTRDRQLPERIRQAILAARQAGHVVTVITGRHLKGTQAILDALEIDCHYGTCQGARVHGIGTDHHVELHLEDEVVQELLTRFGSDPRAEFFLSTRDTMFVRDPNAQGWAWARGEGQRLVAHGTYAGERAHKFIVVSEDAPKVQAELQARFPELAYYLWDDRFLEVVASGGTKGNALAHLAALHSVPREETIAFGDGVNDISMLQWAGRAIGVGHLSPGVAEVIDEHIPAPEELGVAHWLEQHLLAPALQPTN